jgi:hypothetical protein
MADSYAMDIDEEEEAPPRPVDVTPQMQRRGSMSAQEERQRRASIKAILADTSIPDVERRRSIQHLMDGRRASMDGRALTPPPQRRSEFEESQGQNGHGSMSQGLSSFPVASADLLNGSSMLNASMYDFTAQPMANEQTKRAELTRPVCSHYDRNCTIVSPCCGTAFGCRICHDDCPVLAPKTSVQQARRRYPRSSSMPSSFTNMNAVPEDTHHTIDRFAIAEIICRECFTRQNSKT